LRPERGGFGNLKWMRGGRPGALDGDGLEALDLLLLRLGPRRHRGLGAEAVDELLQVGDLALLVLEGGRLLLLARLLLADVVVVVAGVAVERPAAELEDPGAERVQEGAVVRDDDEAAGVARQVVLEPEERLEVEVVGRLVEQEQRGLATRRRARCARITQPPEKSSSCRWCPG
jgi:hypothetical protein